MFAEEISRTLKEALPEIYKVNEMPDGKEYMDPKGQRRNSHCRCGSGLKYKKCCGRPAKMDLTTFYPGRILNFVFYEGSDEKEYQSLLTFANGCKQNATPIHLDSLKRNVKLLNVESEHLGEGTEYPLYTIIVRGEIL